MDAVKSTVYVVGGDNLCEQMFIKNGWELADHPEDADLILFTGGADVDPMLYSEPKHPSTGCSPVRDSKEADIFNRFDGVTPMAGICRGGQFLNVMNGGRMWQDVDNHAVSRGHFLWDTMFSQDVLVSSTHHQMMDPTTAVNYVILATASLTTVKRDGWGNEIKQDFNDNERDVEVVWFPESESLCFQPHPEYFDFGEPCQKLFFDYLRNYMGLE